MNNMEESIKRGAMVLLKPHILWRLARSRPEGRTTITLNKKGRLWRKAGRVVTWSQTCSSQRWPHTINVQEDWVKYDQDPEITQIPASFPAGSTPPQINPPIPPQKLCQLPKQLSCHLEVFPPPWMRQYQHYMSSKKFLSPWGTQGLDTKMRSVTSHNTHKQLLTSFQPILDSSNHFCHLPHDFQDCQNQVSTLELSCYQLLTLDIIYSKVSSLVSFWPCLHVHIIHVYLPCCVFHWHLVYPHPHTYCTSDFPDYAMTADPIYKTPNFVWYAHVQILTLILFPLSTWSHLDPLEPRALDRNKELFPEVQNRGSRFKRVKMRSSRQWKENQSQYLNMSISYKIRILYMGSAVIALIWEVRSAIGVRWG